ncbi:hypothetical protein G4V62_05925 [Bacillaceae bacterium SIJ1]|uniref:spore germination protein GerPC n=1 Tax=Litoribacterium kuwaitense TaxID=1398745 RepID=UPI0013EBAA01|nr:spore germination protein GerPC [Litoribacterium kuwaitense]NGP44518.1 hypothetical protein [Litoribacterium kuwaitense]
MVYSNQHPYHFQQLIQQMQRHEEQIRDMTSRIEQLEAKLTSMMSTPTMHVDRIEYKFDQLKIETLSGSLSIGISPQDIEEFSPPTSTPSEKEPANGGFSDTDDPLVVELQDMTRQWIMQEGPQLIEQMQHNHRMKPNHEMTEHMLKDVSTQLPARIGYYVRHIRDSDSNVSDNALKQEVFKRMKKDIHTAFQMFLQHLPTHQSEEESE